MLAICLSLASLEPPVAAEAEAVNSKAAQVSVIEADARAMLALAQNALANKRPDLARSIYEALVRDSDPGIRNEARYRLAIIAAEGEDWERSIALLRAVLVEDPAAQPVRLQLALALARAKDFSGARAALREAGSRPLPPIVARHVERLYARLGEHRTSGIDMTVFLAGDSNVNRATRSDTIGTVIGDFILDEDARPVSGTGIGVNSEAFVRRPLGERSAMLLNAALLGEMYRDPHFNDIAAVVSTGVEFPLAGGRGRALAGIQRRWLGGERLLDSIELGLEWRKPIAPWAQMRTNLGVARQTFAFNPLQDSHLLNASGRIDATLGTRSGISIEVAAARQLARDPAYSLTSGRAGLSAWREFGPLSLFATASYQRLQADDRLALLPVRRKEDQVRASIGAGHRALNWQGWTPRLHAIWERTESSIEIYSYQRVRGEISFARGF